MITDGKKWHYLAVKKLSALLRRITSNRVKQNHGEKFMKHPFVIYADLECLLKK